LKVTPKSVISDRTRNEWLLVSEIRGDVVHMVDYRGRHIEANISEFETGRYDTTKRFAIKDNYTNE
jgi:hypothetical protein